MATEFQEQKQETASYLKTCLGSEIPERHFCRTLLVKASYTDSPDSRGRERDSTSRYEELQNHFAKGCETQGGIIHWEPS